MLRRLGLLLLVGLVLAGCRSGQDPTLDGEPATTVDRSAPLHPEVEDLLEDAAAGAETSFTATYEVLKKLGGDTSTVTVEHQPPAARISVDDLVVVTGPEPATCRPSAGACVEGAREDRLAAFGVSSVFYADGAVEALRSLGQRADAGAPERSERAAAGVALRCISVPVEGVVANTTCITPEGIVAFVDTAATRVELTALSTGPPDAAIAPPHPFTDDPSFLTDP